MNTPNTHTGPERRLQTHLRELIAKHQAWGWELVSRHPLRMRRGRAVLSMTVPGVVTTHLEPAT